MLSIDFGRKSSDEQPNSRINLLLSLLNINSFSMMKNGFEAEIKTDFNPTKAPSSVSH
jgi:hypothetical protein